MLEFWKDGNKIEINPIYSSGRVGQSVIYGEKVNWGENPNPISKPLSKYPYLSIFTIIEKKEGKEGYYLLEDENGNQITLKDKWHGASESYLYDTQEWLNWNNMRENEKHARMKRRIEQLEGNLDLLKDILIKQGIRVVSENEAKTLGICDNKHNI